MKTHEQKPSRHRLDVIFPWLFVLGALVQTYASPFSDWVPYQKMQNFKGYSMLNSNFWDSSTQENVRRKTIEVTTLKHRPPFLVKEKSITQHFLSPYRLKSSCIKLFTASFKTLFSLFKEIRERKSFIFYC